MLPHQPWQRTNIQGIDLDEIAWLNRSVFFGFSHPIRTSPQPPPPALPAQRSNSDQMRTLQIGLRYFVSGEGGTQWGVYMAAAVLVCLPVIAIYFLVQKSFVESMATTGLKDI